MSSLLSRQADASSSSPDRRVGGLTAVLLVVANMVGTGVFTTTGFLVRDIRSAPAVLCAWLVGGLLALCGALAYAELTAALPRNGGEYQILSRVYHPLLGFLAGWISLVVGFSAPIAASALAFGRYLAALVPGVSPLPAAALLVAVLSVVHATHVRAGSGVQNLFTLVKVILIGVLITGGLIAGDPTRITAGEGRSLVEALLSPETAVGLVFVSFSYSGWNGAAYLAGEVRRPDRTLPLALVAGTGLVVLFYLGLNFVFLAAAPAEELAGVVEIGHVAACRLFGPRAGQLLSGVIALALVSSVSAMIMAGPRVYQAMAEDLPRLRWLAFRTRHGGPAPAAALQAAVALLLLVSATFEVLLTYIGFVLSVCAGLTVMGVLVLRWRQPDLPRPYRVPLYPAPPLLFAALSAWMVTHTLLQRPAVSLWGLLTLAVGVGLWAVLGSRSREPMS